MAPQDLIVIVIVALGLGYGFFIGRSRVIAGLLGLYSGYAVAQLAGPAIGLWLIQRGIMHRESQPWLLLGLLWATTLLFLYRFRIDASVGKGSGIMSHLLTAVFATLVAALGLTLTIGLLIATGQSWNTPIIREVLSLQALWAGLPLLLWAILSLLKR